MDNQYYIYITVPEYTRQFALNHFGDKEDKGAINVKNWYVLNGFMMDNLRRNTYHAHFSGKELGNLKVIVPDSRMKRKRDWNYMMADSRRKMAKLIREIMFAQFWVFVMPNWEAIRMDRRHRHKTYTMDRCINEFFEEHGITYSEEASNSFKKEFARTRKKLEENIGIKI